MEILLEAKKRENTKKEACKRYRKEGFIPAVIYGAEENKNILINSLSFSRLYPKLTKSTVINIKLDGKKKDVFIKDYDKDYLKDRFLHIDFFELDAKKPARVDIPINVVGNAVGIRDGGSLEKHTVAVTVECLPKDMVPHFEINIEDMKINESFHIKDLVLGDKYKIITNPEEVVVRISGIKAEEQTDDTTTTTTTAATTTPTTTEAAATPPASK
ncbi:MAG TPA: 50S ribosomal protein L25 [Spirochaetota bacterium]|nr:50S ribosomal protein L25 [Spirochaetota bacterium]HOS33753.1 50S ribosomal protein L25 [Spirochaetota bacterium]HOS56756.1 50S ribosomal protein L25 [Spirochaetota bacterium]HPK62512.1 50S ribosomal protein L25 [Spirochaetota bacterium]HQF79014.1 50S ribosomal protein L25 [Spirochaetota bacterium]